MKDKEKDVEELVNHIININIAKAKDLIGSNTVPQVTTHNLN